MNRTCKKCTYYDVCPERSVCEDYYPLNEDVSDDQVERMIENGRDEFRLAWLEYISEYN